MNTILKKQKPLATKAANVKSVAITACLVGLLSVSGQASAASECKGLENQACNQNNACGWVNGYERKDGRKVKSFCRTKAKAKPIVAKPKTTDKKS